MHWLMPSACRSLPLGQASKPGTGALNHAHEAWPGGVCGRCGAVKSEAGIGTEETLAGSTWRTSWPSCGRSGAYCGTTGPVWLNYGDAYGRRGSRLAGMREVRRPDDGVWHEFDTRIANTPLACSDGRTTQCATTMP